MKTYKKVFFRSAVTGKFVSKRFAEENPTTTVREERTVKCKK